MPRGVYKRINPPWNKGKKGVQEFSEKTRLNMSKAQMGHPGRYLALGESHHQWKGEKAGKVSIHMWLHREYGKAGKCENREKQFLKFRCNIKSNNYDWANNKNHNYTRDIKDYYQLCVSCHRKYDMTDEQKQKISKYNSENPTRYWLGKKRPDWSEHMKSVWANRRLIQAKRTVASNYPEGVNRFNPPWLD